MLGTFWMLTDPFRFSNGPLQDRVLSTRTGAFTFISQMSLSGELLTGSGLDINQYWEQRDACDQSNLLVGCFNNEYASSWLTGRFSKGCLILIGWSFWKPFIAFSARVLFRVEELRLVVPSENSVFANLSTINRAIAWLVDERHILPSKSGIHRHNRSVFKPRRCYGQYVNPWIKCFKAIGFVHNDELVGKITEDPKLGLL